MRNELTAAVEGLTRRKVVAFMSASHVEPDLAAEVFVLDEPFLEAEARCEQCGAGLERRRLLSALLVCGGTESVTSRRFLAPRTFT